MREHDVREERDRVESNEKDFLIERAIIRLERNLGLAKFPRHNSQEQSQLRLLAIVERVPKLAFPCNQISEYPSCDHRAFTQ